MDARRLTWAGTAGRQQRPGVPTVPTVAAVAVLAPALVATLVGCSPGSTGAEGSSGRSEPSTVPALEATSGFGRHAAVRAKADVRLVNTGAAEIRLATLQVQHPLFQPLAPIERRTVLPPTGDVHLVPVPLGQPRCDQDDPSGASLLVGLQTSEGVDDVVLPLRDREPGLVRAHRLACATAAVQDVVTVELRTDGTRRTTADGPGLVTILHLQRGGPGAVTVTELGGSILFSVAGTPPSPLLSLPPATAAAQAEVVLLAGRCDQHALIESKTSFTFPLFAQVDGGEPARLTTTAVGGARQALQSLLDETCTDDGPGSTSP